jgi:hypothetical protein
MEDAQVACVREERKNGMAGVASDSRLEGAVKGSIS